PYAGHSANASLRREVGLTGAAKTVRTFIGRLIEDYKQVDGKPLGEKNPKWLQDDYVKFLRWGQWRISQTGRGILAMITNHGYLDNPTFRGMRQQLMQSFSEIYLLNLHGNAKKKEVCPDGSKDENVFDIQQGVAIGLFVKTPGSPGPARVHYADLWGIREGKNQTLAQMEVGTTPWQELQPRTPFYLFVPQETELRAEYERGWKLTEIIPIHGVGMTTARDHMVIDFGEVPILERAQLFRDSEESDKELCQRLSIPMKKGWNISNARRVIKKENDLRALIKPILYRPFDQRLIFYHDSLVWRTVKQIMRHMLAGENLGLISARSNKSQNPDHFFCSRFIMETKCGESTTQSALFPLYIYSKDLFIKDQKTPNINPTFIKDLTDKLGLAFMPKGRGDLETTFGPEDVFSYAYAVFHSPTYRQRYAGFLKLDFPRLPLTGNKALFKALVGLGAEMVFLHLMESPRLESFITRFPVSGSQVVEGVRYEDSARRVYINSEQYFEGIPPEVWAFTIGGYQVCHKWLKDRKGRVLSAEDVAHYQKIVVALNETIRLMKEIDEVIEQHGG
ncbi:MAG: type ISP restriction/modification enzyme, partial [Deltaproteobacteria bacterium]|nr:type ISP restriction/modification enzyme [Deltaproteobacteria bacterium]